MTDRNVGKKRKGEDMIPTLIEISLESIIEGQTRKYFGQKVLKQCQPFSVKLEATA